MKTLMIAAVLLLAPQLAAGECLQVKNAEVADMGEDELGTVEVTWRAEIENHCDSAYDADLTVRFEDKEGKRLYEARDLATLHPRTAQQVGKRLYVPVRAAREIAHVAVAVDERERPF